MGVGLVGVNTGAAMDGLDDESSAGVERILKAVNAGCLSDEDGLRLVVSTTP